jgi:hypothetical protein
LSEKQKFQEIVREIRSDLAYLKELQSKLSWEIVDNGQILFGTFDGRQRVPEVKAWVTDVYIDKLFETNSKIRKLLSQLELKEKDALTTYFGLIRKFLEHIVFNIDKPFSDNKEAQKIGYSLLLESLTSIDKFLKEYEATFERLMIAARNYSYDTNWSKMKTINLEDYILPTRRAKYVSARDELEKAKQAVNKSQWEEVLNHLRPAIDLAIKEKFGFKKINPMKQFIIDAEKFGLQLPTYTMLYDYFDEGSQRIHSGKLNTPYECQKALEFVAGFIDRLDLTNVPKDKIDEFRRNCKAVE